MWTGDEVLQGFALAAALAGDRGASRAMIGLSEETAVIAREAQRLTELTSEDRERTLGVWARNAAGRCDAPPPCEHPRALALLAAHVPPTLGRSLLAAAPPPRAGYVPDAALVQVLLGTWKALSA